MEKLNSINNKDFEVMMECDGKEYHLGLWAAANEVEACNIAKTDLEEVKDQLTCDPCTAKFRAVIFQN